MRIKTYITPASVSPKISAESSTAPGTGGEGKERQWDKKPPLARRHASGSAAAGGGEGMEGGLGGVPQGGR